MSNFLTTEDMTLLESRGEIQKYGRNELILSQKHKNTGVYWVREGQVRVELSRLYREVVVAGLRTGEMFGEMSFLMNDAKTTSKVVSHKDTVVLFVSRDDLKDLLKNNDGLAARFYKTAAITLAERLKAQTKNG